MLTNNTVVGYYSAAEKIVKSILGLLDPIAQAAYPRFSKMAAESRDLTLAWGRRMLAMMGGIGFLLMVGVLGKARFISDLLLGSEFAPSVAVMRGLAPIIFLIALSNVMGVQMLFPLHHDRFVLKVVLTAGLLNIAVALVLVPKWSANGMAVSVLLSELFVTMSYAVFLLVREDFLSIKSLFSKD
jgi:PST family polysaccharide transporter